MKQQILEGIFGNRRNIKLYSVTRNVYRHGRSCEIKISWEEEDLYKGDKSSNNYTGGACYWSNSSINGSQLEKPLVTNYSKMDWRIADQEAQIHVHYNFVREDKSEPGKGWDKVLSRKHPKFRIFGIR